MSPSWAEKKLKRVVPAADLDLSDNLFRFLTKKAGMKTVGDFLEWDPETILRQDPLAVVLYEEALQKVNQLREKDGRKPAPKALTDPHADSAFRVFGFGVSRKLYGFFSKDFGLPFLDIIRQLKPNELDKHPDYADCADEFRFLLARLKAPGFHWSGAPWEMRGKTGVSRSDKKPKWGYYDENNPPPKGGRPRKYKTEKERQEKQRAYNREYYHRVLAPKRAAARADRPERPARAPKPPKKRPTRVPRGRAETPALPPSRQTRRPPLKEIVPEDFRETGLLLSPRVRRYFFGPRKIRSLEEFAALDPGEETRNLPRGYPEEEETKVLIEHVRKRLQSGPPPSARLRLADLWPDPAWHEPFAREFVFTAETAQQLSRQNWEALLPERTMTELWIRLSPVFLADVETLPETPVAEAWAALQDPLGHHLMESETTCRTWVNLRDKWLKRRKNILRGTRENIKGLTRITLALLKDPALAKLTDSFLRASAAQDFPITASWFADQGPGMNPDARHLSQHFLHVLAPDRIEPVPGQHPQPVSSFSA